jgi:hypothetical protein
MQTRATAALFGVLMLLLAGCSASSWPHRSRCLRPTAKFIWLFNGEPAPMQPGFTPHDENNVMPMELDMMTYADR